MWWKILVAIVTFSLGYRCGLCFQFLQDVKAKLYYAKKAGNNGIGHALFIRKTWIHLIFNSVILTVIFLIVINRGGLKIVYLYSLVISIVVSVFRRANCPITDGVIDMLIKDLDNEKSPKNNE